MMNESAESEREIYHRAACANQTKDDTCPRARQVQPSRNLNSAGRQPAGLRQSWSRSCSSSWPARTWPAPILHPTHLPIKLGHFQRETKEDRITWPRLLSRACAPPEAKYDNRTTSASSLCSMSRVRELDKLGARIVSFRFISFHFIRSSTIASSSSSCCRQLNHPAGKRAADKPASQPASQVSSQASAAS